MTDNLQLLRKLLEARVEFVVIGGVAAAFHGSSLTTYDLDLCSPSPKTTSVDSYLA